MALLFCGALALLVATCADAGAQHRNEINSVSAQQLNAYRDALRRSQAVDHHWQSFSILHSSCQPSSSSLVDTMMSALLYIEERIGQPVPYWDFNSSATIPSAFLDATYVPNDGYAPVPNPLLADSVNPLCRMDGDIDDLTKRDIRERLQALPMLSAADRFSVLFDAMSVVQGVLGGCLISLETAPSHPLWISMLSYVITTYQSWSAPATKPTPCPSHLMVPASTAVMLSRCWIQDEDVGMKPGPVVDLSALQNMTSATPDSKDTVQLFIKSASGIVVPGPLVTRRMLQDLHDNQDEFGIVPFEEQKAPGLDFTHARSSPAPAVVPAVPGGSGMPGATGRSYNDVGAAAPTAGASHGTPSNGRAAWIPPIERKSGGIPSIVVGAWERTRPRRTCRIVSQRRPVAAEWFEDALRPWSFWPVPFDVFICWDVPVIWYVTRCNT
ncbi:Tyrosinase copper-binding domain-containing protein [Plasmodiophora brassicae]|uniref:Tyrosinase copper-binding domain-containing protein n=1 Tax=Plasmodiophora brassicae TaxID=37360 RepID=A0A0G4IZ63_PLABS|nr:hypothetical protein PBRA_001657 [Plasmodiophora brassicae]SPQ93905.1 unnamed protein product [Plasmodiophora brassicae]